MTRHQSLGIAGRLASIFIDSKLTPLLIAASILIGLGAVALLPREEEPQIIVPMVDVFVQMPGASPREVEQRITKPMEKLLWEIPGVEYIYSTSSSGVSMAIVRFKVGEDEEKAIVRLNQKLYANADLIPPGAYGPLVKPRSIDDVPVLALTLSSDRYDHFALRRIAGEIKTEVKQVENVSAVDVIGGLRRQLRVVVDPARAAAYGFAPAQIARMVQQSNSQMRAGAFSNNNAEVLVETGGFLASAEDAARIVVGAKGGHPVYLGDVASIQDGPQEAADYVYTGTKNSVTPAVTISIAKRKNTNATKLAETILEKVDSLKGVVIPADVHVGVTRNYGETAAEKSNELLFHMLLAVLSVALLIGLVLGFRESGIVAMAIPVTLALTLAVFFIFGYTLNRVTLFALIFSIGILVDDAIVVVENIVRHHRLPENRRRPLRDVAIEAVAEVGNPTILATFTVIAAILPMGFVRGLMGPYMRPIPVGASAAMLFSLVVAFIVTPWAAIRLLKKQKETSHGEEGRMTRTYRRVMSRILLEPRLRYGFLGAVAVMLVLAVSMFAVKLVRVKMLPFDNKSELQVIVDMPEGTPLERTAAATRDIAAAISGVPEVANYQTYAGTASPFNFNGLVRHYFLRQGSNVADVQVNLLPKGKRSAQSHEIAKRMRTLIAPVAKRWNANVKVAEVPPGPPVLQTLVAEIYGPDYDRQVAIAKQVQATFNETAGVVDVDSYVEDDQVEYRFVVDKEKAALTGVSPDQIDATLRLALSGLNAGLLHQPGSSEDIDIVVQLPRAQRSSIGQLEGIRVMSSRGALVPLGTLVRIEQTIAPKSIYHKNLMPVVYVTGDIAGSDESPVYAILKLNRALDGLILPEGYAMERFVSRQPFFTDRYAMKWDGEWHITYEVFRDLGLAFAAVLVLIYVLVVGWFQSFRTPLTIMAAIPFSLVGIIPAHAMAGAFFTATSMIGFIAGAGIVVRNSIILVDFIELRLKQGMPLREAVIDAGAVRARPMILTAAAVIVGAVAILFDPIFQGVAISLMAGEVASVLLSLPTVPILFYLSERRRQKKDQTEVPLPTEEEVALLV
ncbi:MAG TPA: efflux RND transporter permease subunit [Thermoanaerobaculia bacterium]|nr:efflux RND transporter permease subunit [Thermoanaerobaculia bacterium]